MAQAQPVEIPAPPTGVTQAELDALWQVLLANANQAKLDYMYARTPAELQPHLEAYIANDTEDAPVKPGDPVPVWASPSGLVLQGSPGVAVVEAGALARVDLPTPTTRGYVNDGQAVAMQDAAGAAIAGASGVAVVASHSLTAVKYTPPTPPATQATVTNGQTCTVENTDLATAPGVIDVAGGVVVKIRLV